MTQKDYTDTLLLSSTDFPMRGNLPRNEPLILERWAQIDLYERCREQAKGCELYVLHDGPPYANGNLHIGHALNKVLKDIVSRSMQMVGYDVHYVPGWDCHGLPIEWKVEEGYRQSGRMKDDVEISEFRSECRNFALHWLNIQRSAFKRLGVGAAWEDPYMTMSYAAEAQIARELMKFAVAGQLYQGLKPVFWSVVEQTALAEAEVEYLDHETDVIWVSFPVLNGGDDFLNVCVVIWTTTPWTIPCNRAICFSLGVHYGLYRIRDVSAESKVSPGASFIVADDLVSDVMHRALVLDYDREREVSPDLLSELICAHPLRGKGYDFVVPLLPGAHVTADMGTGFVHTAPGHGPDDFDIWRANKGNLEERKIETVILETVDADGFFTNAVPGFSGRRIITDTGGKGDADDAVIEALQAVGALVASDHLKHKYPHSWRSRKPVIFRSFPQWFIPLDRIFKEDGLTLRERALRAIDEVRFVPGNSYNRLHKMLEHRPDWLISRQRVWGVPLTIFVNSTTGDVLVDPDVNNRIATIFEEEGSDSWFAEGAAARFLGPGYCPGEWKKIDDILDVWFDSGSTHAFVLEDRPDLKWPADLYLEGSDQHRGWFQSSLLESCGTRGRPPFKAVLTHGFVLSGDGRKMSKSLGNQVFPQEVIDQSGADILRLWVMSVDYTDDIRISPDILKSVSDIYRRLRNTVRFLLRNLSGFSDIESLSVGEMPNLECWILHRLWELDDLVREGYHDFAYQRLFSALSNFATVDLSATYFDIRKDVLYCESASSVRRRACRTVLDHIFRCLTTWMSPVLCFTMDEAWRSRFPGEDSSVHLQRFPDIPSVWCNEKLDRDFCNVRRLRRLVNASIEKERSAGVIGSSLESFVVLYVSDPELLASMSLFDMRELCLSSYLDVRPLEEAPAAAFRLTEEVAHAAVIVRKADGKKCARCWMILPEVGSLRGYEDICRRCVSVLGEVA
ncbi:MAG: isoleucine--tRNA ligase [Alphaproteobacteria bacterium]|nr:isoleucine--tRNA ligase [Alphaproteobacteria bacterium]